MFIHVNGVEYLEDYKLRLRFNTGIEGIVDLESELYGAIFEPLRDKLFFQQVFLTSRTIEWPNGADFAPEFLLERMRLAEIPQQQTVSTRQTSSRKAASKKGKKTPILTEA